MEPDVIRIYSSSPPPLVDTAEEEDEEFGDFGGFSGVASSVSFSEFDAPKGLSQGQAHATDMSPPGAFAASFTPDFTPGGPGRGSSLAQLRSDHEPRDPGCSHASLLSERIFPNEDVRRSAQEADGGRTESRAHDCNGDVPAAEVLTNGFAPYDREETPVVRPKKRRPAARPTLDCSEHRPVTSSAQADTPKHCSQVLDAQELTNGLPEGKYLAGAVGELHFGTALAETSLHENEVEGDACSTGHRNNGVSSSCTGEEFEPGDPKLRNERLSAPQDGSPAVGNGTEEAGPEVRHGSLCCSREGAGQMGGEERGMEDECAVGFGTVSASVSDDFASFCQAVSPDGLEDFGDFSASGFTVPPFPEDEEPTADCTNEEGSFGDFGQTLDRDADFATRSTVESTAEGDFGGPEDGESRKEVEEGQGDFAGFPGSDSFADFSSAPSGAELDGAAGWNAFGQPEEGSQAGGHSWASFRNEQSDVVTDGSEGKCWDAAVAAPPSGSPRTCRRDSLSASLASRLERLFRVSFPEVREPEAGEDVPSLKALLEPPDGQPEPGEEQSSASHHGEPRDMWWRLQDIHDAFGLRYQWGGSHSNKTLLCSLGMDTRNILFTGQKKQPVIVPMYAAGLGMLEPTKDPVNPVSPADKMASMAQAPSMSPEMSTSPDSTQQEALPPIQFDWSSSGLTNPLDGADPEQTTAKLETSGTSSLPDAIARLMSAVEKTSTSARKPRLEEKLSEEAARVMVALPDLSFMHARVLMFPATLTRQPART
ncbi:hypothetical protein SKAU_G00165880 [Synaphobranchus kaupii]|uniref:Aftiphilin clathrin-binding box domain-containing protein n=1 Tax=Synaphobranchus kaupii TaxID=118154 RepID=A0A9Q1IZW3_SYNKA|nr:hypothetical protein SKAU_G00165880 [Synaphobranchus kaupii]